MSRDRKKSRKRIRGSYYPLSEVKRKIESGDFLIEDNVYNSAYHDFGWKHDDIEKAYKLLIRKHFIKTDSLKTLPGFIAFDSYKAHIRGEDIYTHFYIDDYSGKLIINSFKQDNAF